MKNQNVFSGRVVFDHLPKTAGQAINSWLVDMLGSGTVTQNLNGVHEQLLRRYGGLFPIISGHIRFERGDKLDPRYQYATLLRDPFDRAMSWIFYLINNVDKNPTSDSALLIEGAKLFLKTEGNESNSAFLDSLRNPYVNHFLPLKGQMAVTNEEQVAACLSALDEYDIIGFYEGMPAFLQEFAAMLGASNVCELPSINVTIKSGEAETSSVLRRNVAALTSLDQELYDALRARHNCKAGSFSPVAALSNGTLYSKYVALPKDNAIVSNDLIVGKVATLTGHKVKHGGLISLTVDFLCLRELISLEIGFHLIDEGGEWAYATNSNFLEAGLGNVGAGAHRASFSFLAALPAGHYRFGLSFGERLEKGYRCLAWREDIHYFEVQHVVKHSFVGYSNLPTVVALHPTCQAVASLETARFAQGGLEFLEQLGKMKVGANKNIRIRIRNDDASDWMDDVFRPINLMFAWFLDDVLIMDGYRTPISTPIYAGEAREASISIESPALPGRYQLKITLVQEWVGWFDEGRFLPAKAVVDVEPG